MTNSTHAAHGDSESQFPQCDCCGDPAVVRGILIVNNNAYANTPLCATCHVPPENLSVPDPVSIENLLEEHPEELITAPEDTVLISGEETIIRHGPGDESRLILGTSPA